jgi:hypothetical protein
MTDGGEGCQNRVVTEEYLDNLSKRMAGTGNHMYGKEPWNKGLTKENSNTLWLVGQKVSVARSNCDTRGPNNHFFGKKHSEQSRSKMRAPRKDCSKIGKYERSEDQRDQARLQLQEMKKKTRPCDVCGRVFNLGNYTKHIRKCS